jgi:ketosteroid isomerase-like protein
MGGTFALHDGVHVEQVTGDVGFAAGNVDFTGTSGRRTYRVLAIFTRVGGAWRIVQSHWSLGLPVPGVR